VVGVPELALLDDSADALALTFDDGFVSFATEAMPLLLDHGLPATLFIVTDHVGGDNSWRGRSTSGIPVLPLLDWDALGRLRESGVTLGAHTRTHPNLPMLTDGLLEEEILGGADAMERRLGERPQGFAYPFGAVNSRVAGVVARCYRWACTTEFRPMSAGESLTLLPRLDAWYFRETDRFANWGSPSFRVWVWYRRQGRRARTAMQAHMSV
jgi:peptidoglycan/xylan/chitin deacetylase (PgdA/CDA1 family)